ncbi:MAG: hypothetical protein VKK97_07230 [Synechococcaceae cyanobacterium]|nr:hypothetical protein [Synechococcaceae cyanobacterium]
MTNLQDGVPSIPTAGLQRIWFMAPVVAGVGLAALLTGVVLLPMVVQVNKDRERVAELEGLQGQLALLRRELSTLAENRDQAQRLRLVLINLLAGNRDVGTFLAQLDNEASASGVTLRLYEPQAPAQPVQPGQPPVAGQSGSGPSTPGQPGATEPASPCDPLLVREGLECRQLVLHAQGSYPNLVAFLRRIEQLDVLVGQDTLNLQVDPLPVEALKSGMRVLQPKVSLRQTLSLYYKSTSQAPTSQRGVAFADRPPGVTPVP